MALKTKREFCQEVLHEVYGGMPPSSSRISERFVLTKLNDAIANLAVVNAYSNTNLEGVTYADDTFYISFNSLTLTLDPLTGYKYVTLPAMPVGLPSARSYTVMPTGDKKLCNKTMIKIIDRNEVSRMLSLPKIKKVFAFIQDGKMYFYIDKQLFPLLELTTVNLTMATADGGMDSIVNMPMDMLATAKTKIVQELRGSLMMPQDIKNDGREIKEAQA